MVWDFSLVWGQAILGIAIFAFSLNAAGFVVGVVLVGSAQHGLGLIAHEGGHYLIAPDRKRVNDFIARWLFASPIAIPFSLYRHRHLLHHRYVATCDDTKELYRRDIRGVRLVLEILSGLLGIDYLRQVISTLRRDHKDSAAAPTAVAASSLLKWITHDGPAIAIVQLILLSTLSEIDWRLYPLLWVLPYVTVGTLLSKIRSLVEHRPLMESQGAKPGSGLFMDAESPCFRSVQATWIERIFLSKINFHFHAEHHFWPLVSYQYLPEIHRRIMLSPLETPLGFCSETSYFQAIHKLWAGK